ncbi:MAG: DNA polymerase IV, partial [Candidatus Microthrix parvicella]
TVMLRFRFGDFTRDTRSHSVPEATGSTAAFLNASHGLLVARRDEIERRGLTLLGFTIANVSPADAVQQSLEFDGRSAVDLDGAVDAVRNRYGSDSIGRATLLGRSNGIHVPLLPDPGASRP